MNTDTDVPDGLVMQEFRSAEDVLKAVERCGNVISEERMCVLDGALTRLLGLPGDRTSPDSSNATDGTINTYRRYEYFFQPNEPLIFQRRPDGTWGRVQGEEAGCPDDRLNETVAPQEGE